MELFIEVLVFAVTLYSIIGFIFTCLYLAFGLEETDPAARATGPFFKALITPGVIVFWPLFAIRWIIGVKRPPQERNAHRIAAKTYHHR
jgi:hypothetical protein